MHHVNHKSQITNHKSQITNHTQTAAAVESPETKNKFKSFYKEFWSLARSRNTEQAHQLGVSQFSVLPEKVCFFGLKFLNL